MTDYSAKNVDEYIANAPRIARSHLRQIRATIQAAVPNVEEGISYGKPYYKYYGYLAGFDSFKNHIGFELWVNQLQTNDRNMLKEKGFKTGSRTFQIRYDQKVPTTIITKLLKEQAKLNKEKMSISKSLE
ncbi:MAG TPA: DUF1801 domain-containing protein [Candidatus Saccharimonadales bacterium]|nr:DUF1801 domain-containing protein [Candidatus Saccharimonadales bacterium]